MSRHKYSEFEQQLNNVLSYQSRELQSIKPPSSKMLETHIGDSEELLKSLGYSLPKKVASNHPKKVAVLPDWEKLCLEAEQCVGANCDLESLFTAKELQENHEAIIMLNREFNQLYKLDKVDVTISAVAGIIGAAVDILLVGIPQKTPDGVSAGKLSNYIRDMFEKKFPSEEMKSLANSKRSKVPYDAQDNRHTTQHVKGLSSYYHRLLSLGHDPLLGFIVGVFDIMTGRMTTIDKDGKFVSQVMENYTDRKESNLFVAIAKQLLHLKTDVNTSMGLPVPLMALFNLLQFGSIGEENQTIAEIVQGMYFEGYDFIHFCSMSIPTMIVEVIVRLCYGIKRHREGYNMKESIPYSLNREKHPKLATMLFIGHSGATAINAGKVYFTKNPMAINYPQWIAFAKCSYRQLKWVMIEKPEKRNSYVLGTINEELDQVIVDTNHMWHDFTSEYIVVMESP